MGAEHGELIEAMEQQGVSVAKEGTAAAAHANIMTQTAMSADRNIDGGVLVLDVRHEHDGCFVAWRLRELFFNHVTAQAVPDARFQQDVRH